MAKKVWLKTLVQPVYIGVRFMFHRLLQHLRTPRPRELCETWALLNQAHLVSYARACVGDFVDAELVTSKAMHSVMEAFYAGQVPQEKLMPYARKAIRNYATNLYIKEKNRLEAENTFTHTELIENRDASAHRAISPEEHDLHMALRQLPDDIAGIIILHIWEKHSFTDIANLLDISKSTVRRKYQQGIETIKSQLSE